MIVRLFLVFFLVRATYGKKHPLNPSSQPWQTLNGQRPAVIARGGYSGIYPESTDFANSFAMQTSLPDAIIYCSLQLSKDGSGYCLSSLKLDNTTNIADVFPNAQKSYNVNGEEMEGYFALDYTAQQLDNVSLIQNLFSRPSLFDALLLPISTVQQVIQLHPPGFWLNVQYNNFYIQHKLDPALYVQNILKTTAINYLSSPEIGFLKTMAGKVNKAKTQLIFVFKDADSVEPTTNKTYSFLLKDLSSIKLFVSGILVPKEYIWPVNAQMYLDKPTTLVADAHKAGLEVYAYSFSNDNVASYNYSYDPTAEYLQFIDNSQFSVDGFLTDFPSTASEAIACLAHNKNASRLDKGKTLVISHNGASGVYPGSTDLAYQQAVDDGADIIDCSVQMSKDGVPFCLDSADLATATTAKTTFMTRASTVPEIQTSTGIFSFDLTWTEIQTLQPVIANPFSNGAGLLRNPANKNKGKFITLVEFLEFSKQKKLPGILINIQNAAYLASNKGLSITDAVATALSNATLDKQSTQKVLIQSEDSSVLSKFSDVPTYKKVLLIEKELISDVPKATVGAIKKFADAVNLKRGSIIPSPNYFTTTPTDVVAELHKANISVYVSVFRNEYIAIAMDYFSDPIVELSTFILPPFEVDGIITDYPATATAYLKSPCSNPNANLDYTILPIQPGGLLQSVPMPPAGAPAPSLNVADVVDPPLPSVSNVSGNVSGSPAPNAATAQAAPPPGTSGQAPNVVNLGLGAMGIMLFTLIYL
ncbi:hypothetical protein U1Q18_042764 [Sarracenia purpurea var. burkii]